ncbi:hypothetical protein RclHR1_05530011 [Rhizophagus clarus]|uniref:HTH myb-type domain-containing protein n=1 Tax=Rhizophagus clarus TaxID=94130 RepID=A0A2Z6S652_9GLOM|nr:hypothetical protein RclHR1_05530011 [Rhizophagus clarus]GET03696.1 hypothetical protein GLOIN_2v1662628 [Rhizophagus clarus]
MFPQMLPQEKYIILSLLKHFERIGNVRNPFVRLSEIFNYKYSPSQLSNHYRNYLNPQLYLGDLSDEEMNFIDDWISHNRTGIGAIRWMTLIEKLKRRFGLLRSENKVKNYWYSKQKRSRNSCQRRRRSSTSSRTSTIVSATIPISMTILPFDPTATLTPPLYDDYTYQQRQRNYLLPTLECDFRPKPDNFLFEKFL